MPCVALRAFRYGLWACWPCLDDIFVPMLCALCLCVSVLLGSPLGRVPWARLPRQKLQLGFENNFETVVGFLH